MESKKLLPSLGDAKKASTLAPLESDIFPSKQKLKRKTGHPAVGSSGGIARDVEAPAGFSTHSNPLATTGTQPRGHHGDISQSPEHKPRERRDEGQSSDHKPKEKREALKEPREIIAAESGRRPRRHGDGEEAGGSREAATEKPREKNSGRRKRNKEPGGGGGLEEDEERAGIRVAATLENTGLSVQREEEASDGTRDRRHERQKKVRNIEATGDNIRGRDPERRDKSADRHRSRTARKKSRERQVDEGPDSADLKKTADDEVPSKLDHDVGEDLEESKAVEFEERAMQASMLVYNEETGQLSSNLTGGAVAPSQDDSGKKRIYVEGSTDGYFHRIDLGRDGAGGLLGWLYLHRRRQSPAPATPNETAGADVEGRVLLQVLWDQACAVLGFTSIMSQCLLGGFALLNLFMTYLVEVRGLPGGFLHYYSPIAVNCQRMYLVLSSIALLSACDQYAKDKLTEWRPRGRIKQQRHDCLLILAYLLAFVLSIVGSPFEDVIYYSNLRVPGWYEEGMVNKSFDRNLGLWHALNFVRLVACGAGFVLVVRDLHLRQVDLSAKVKAMVEEEKGTTGANSHREAEHSTSSSKQKLPPGSKGLPLTMLQKAAI